MFPSTFDEIIIFMNIAIKKDEKKRTFWMTETSLHMPGRCISCINREINVGWEAEWAPALPWHCRPVICSEALSCERAPDPSQGQGLHSSKLSRVCSVLTGAHLQHQHQPSERWGCLCNNAPSHSWWFLIGLYDLVLDVCEGRNICKTHLC